MYYQSRETEADTAGLISTKDQNNKGLARFVTYAAIGFISCVLALGFLTDHGDIGGKNFLASLVERELKPEKAEPPAEEKFVSTPAPESSRFPPDYVATSANLFELQSVKTGLRKVDEDGIAACVTDEDMIFTYTNADLVNNDLTEFDGYTAFALDCRDVTGDPYVSYIVVLKMDDGSVANAMPIKKRAESVIMKDTAHILYTCVGEAGTFLWAWNTDRKEKLPFYADSHSLQYVPSTDSYYGCEMADQDVLNAPSMIAAFNSTGFQFFSKEEELSHINYVSVSGDYIYVSLRSFACLQKVSLLTGEVEWTLGSKYSDFQVQGIEGDMHDLVAEINDETGFGTWSHQHRFQHLDDKYFSLFDNHVDDDKVFIDGHNSRMVILQMDYENMIATEVFSYDVGEKTVIYGGTDILPSGNVLGNSFPKVVYPDSHDRKFQENIWEVTPEGVIAQRVGFLGRNPFAIDRNDTAYIHNVPDKEFPVGWVIYNIERFYAKPVVAQPCSVTSASTGHKYVQFMPFNSIRTQEDMPGLAYLYEPVGRQMLTKKAFKFHKAWLPRVVQLVVPEDMYTTSLYLVVTNNWKDSNAVKVGKIDEIPRCSAIEKNRIFHEDKK